MYAERQYDMNVTHTNAQTHIFQMQVFSFFTLLIFRCVLFFSFDVPRIQNATSLTKMAVQDAQRNESIKVEKKTDLKFRLHYSHVSLHTDWNGEHAQNCLFSAATVDVAVDSSRVLCTLC